MKRSPTTIADCTTGDIVAIDAGTIVVGPLSAGAYFCRLATVDDGRWRLVSEPFHVAPRTRVLEVLRDQGHYRPSNVAEVDPLRAP